MSSIHLPRNPVFHACTKHIEVHYHFIHEGVQVGDVELQHISTNLHRVDIFTKAMGAKKLREFMLDLGLTIPDLTSLRGSTNRTLSEPDTSRSGHQPKKPTEVELEGRVENQAQPSLECEHTLENVSTLKGQK